MNSNFLDKVYQVKDVSSTRELYDAWASSYEAEVGKHGYATPARCAKALAQFVEDKSAPILDFGCGTGLSGLALKLAGFEVIDGVDISDEMLAQAEAKKVYRKLTKIDPEDLAPEALSGYQAIAAIGVIGAGAAPATVFDTLMYALDNGGKIVLSLNDHSLANPEFEGRINEWTDCGAARVLFAQRGEHLPGINLKSTVYVLEKA